MCGLSAERLFAKLHLSSQWPHDTPCVGYKLAYIYSLSFGKLRLLAQGLELGTCAC